MTITLDENNSLQSSIGKIIKYSQYTDNPRPPSADPELDRKVAEIVKKWGYEDGNCADGGGMAAVQVVRACQYDKIENYVLEYFHRLQHSEGHYVSGFAAVILDKELPK